jgi:hypothetical protein
MAWVRLSDDFYDHPKFIQAGPTGLAVWIAALAYCNRNLTDGEISESVARRLVDFDGLAYTVATIGDYAGVMEDDCTPLAVELLVESGLWHRRGHTCESCPQPKARHFLFHDYLVYQPSREEVGKSKEVRSIAGKKGAESRWNGKSHSESHGSSHSKTDGKTDGKTMPPTPTPTPTQKDTNTRADALAAEFDEWYRVYPKKVGRPAALTKYKAARRKTSTEILLSGASVLAKAYPKGSDLQFCPNPSTWLNQERWNDEAPQAEIEYDELGFMK